jgi:tellurite resistance protein TerC
MEHMLSNLSVAPQSLWVGFGIGVFILLVIDLLLFKKMSKGNNSHIKIALFETGIWIFVALLFNTWFGYQYGSELGFQFLTGYLVEKSLSIDNLFVILLVFASFKIDKKHQHKVLFYGVLGAVIMRAFFILVGAKLLHHFHWILYLFGLILVITAVKFLKNTDTTTEVKESLVIRLIKKYFPTTDKFDGDKFFKIENGIKKATPMFLALIVIEVTDLVFAVDSIPAVFSVTQDAFIAFASNILALLGLRALYFVIADMITKLRYLKPGLSAILGFIGIKMLLIDFVKIPSSISLMVILTILLVAGLSSWYVDRVNNRRMNV